MIAGELLKLSVHALLANKLRSGLTLLGGVIGGAAVMTVISALEGFMGAIEDDLAVLGPSTFMVSKFGMITSEEEWLEAIKRKPLSIDAKEDIEEGCHLVEKICPRVFAGARVKHGNKSRRDVAVVGSSYGLIDIVELEVAEGRFWSHEDDLHRRQVAFIGNTVKEELFPDVDALGKEIRVDGRKYTVIGVSTKLGSSFGNDQDDYVMIPYTAHFKQFGQPRHGLRFTIKAVSVEKLDDAQDQVRMVLRARRHVPYDKPDDFAILTADMILEFVNNITRVFRLALVGISSISLVVGGIVVMNIMMVSVTERTREIGIRKSIGAKQKHILVQFLFEALLTTICGGLVGILIGYLTAYGLLWWLLDMDISPSAFAILAGVSVSTGIGVLFGIYPAMKAARLDPIKALSYE